MPDQPMSQFNPELMKKAMDMYFVQAQSAKNNKLPIGNSKLIQAFPNHFTGIVDGEMYFWPGNMEKQPADDGDGTREFYFLSF